MNDPEVETGLSSDTLAAGALDRWGPFEGLQSVGRGSFGEVYRAFDPALQRHVALKLLLPGRLDRDEQAAALLREARAIARVRHPNVVPVYGVDRHDGRVGFWTDFVQGRTLAELVASQGSMGAREAALIGIDVCRAAGAVHAAGLLHRDIKAGNVMREQGGRILLMDFGLTYGHGAELESSGTPAYMAPELLVGQRAAIATDIYAIGVTLFYLLTTQYPVTETNIAQLQLAHAAGRRRTLLDVRPDLPEALARVVETALSAAPEKRFGSTGQMIAALSAAIGLEPGPAIEPAPRRRARRAWIIGSIGVAASVSALVLMLALNGGAVLPRPGEPAPAPGQQEDYRRAHELLTHYYRPQALETAIPLLERIVAQDTQFAPAFADLGRANFLQFAQQRETKYIAPARESSLRALALAPDLASAHVTLGFLYAFTGENDLAGHEIDNALHLDRFNAAAYGALAELQNRQGRAELVEATLQKAVSLAPDDWYAIVQLGAHYLDTAKWTLAEEQFRHAVQLVPDNPRAHNDLGLVYRGLGRLDAAAAAFQKAIELEPTFIRARNLGMVLAESGKYPEAVQALTRSIDMRPAQYRAWGLLAGVYANQHADPAKIKETYLKAIALAADLLKETPRDEYLLADVGGYHAALGHEQDAARLLTQAAALAPDVPEVLFQVAVGYELLHRRDEALRWLAKSRAGGYPADAIARNPQLTALRADPRYGSIVSTR